MKRFCVFSLMSCESRSDQVGTGFVELQTSAGPVSVELYWKEAPRTCRNFYELAGRGYYDNTVFHRVIPDFMIQGGDPTGTGRGGPGYRFEDETRGSKHRFDKPGKLAMAN